MKKYYKQNKIDNKNLIDNKIDDKPEQVNLLDLSTDILNIIGNFVKKDNLKRERAVENVEQILNGKKIRFGNFVYNKIRYPVNTKEDIKEYIFSYVNMEITTIKNYAKIEKMKLNKDDIIMCVWVCFKRCKLILDDHKLILNMDDENNYLEEYLTENKLNLKRKKYSFNY